MSPTGRLPATLGAWAFDYTNWHGVRHRYVVDFTTGHAPGYHENAIGDLVLSGEVVTRNDDPREDMGNNRRRTFKVGGMENVQVVS